MGIVPNPSLRGKNYLGYVDEPWEKVYASEINDVKADAYAIAASRSWQPGKAYIEGDVCYPSLEQGKSFMLLECVVAGTTGTTEPLWGNVHTEQVDGSVTWLIKKIGSGEGSGIAIGTTIQHLGITPPEGFLALKGQEVGRATYPELWNWVKEKSGLLVTEADWQTAYGLNSGNCGCYSEGDGSSTFRLPNVTGFLRPQGDGARQVGQFQGDAIRELQGVFPFAPTTQWGTISGVFKKVALASGDTSAQSKNGAGIEFKASTVVPTAEENRPKSITVLFCVKAFNGAMNQGTVDITELANDVSILSNKVDNIPTLVDIEIAKSVDFTIIYPNGGTEASPANIEKANRYIENNPFPGHAVICRVEIFYQDKWCEGGWVNYNTNGKYQPTLGVKSTHLSPDDTIIVQTGESGLTGGGLLGGTGLPINSSIATPTPCRVKVWKVG